MLTFAANEAGRHIHIDDTPSSRGPFFCIVCGMKLIAKRGAIRAHHFAHDPFADCVAAGGEGAIHLSAKLGLQRVLRRVAAQSETILANVSCPCPREFAVPIAGLAPADRVEVEVSRGGLRPDLVVSRLDQDILIIEVVDTHACPPEKWAMFKVGSAPMLEIPADALVSPDGAFIWDPATPLPRGGRVLNLPPAPDCDGCAVREKERIDARERALAEQRERERREDEERRKPRTEVLSVGICCHYLKDGQRSKHRLAVLLDYDDGEVVRARMLADGVRLGEWGESVVSDINSMRSVVIERYEKWRGGQRTNLTHTIEVRWSKPFGFPPLDLEHAFRMHDPPQYLWWDPTRRSWIRAYTMHHLKVVFPETEEHTLFKWRRSRFKLFPLKAFEGAKDTMVMDAEAVDRFARWLKTKMQQDPLQAWRNACR